MNALLRIGFALGVSAAMAGCAVGVVPTAVVTPLATKVIPQSRVKHAVVPGTSTKADVIAALGETLVIRFDSGYEVWVYRLDDGTSGEGTPSAPWLRRAATPEASAEFVILFAPSGVVTKTRIRPAPANVARGTLRMSPATNRNAQNAYPILRTIRAHASSAC